MSVSSKLASIRKRKNSLYRNKMGYMLKLFTFIFCVFLLFSADGSYAQKKAKKRYYSGTELRGGGQKSTSFLNQQWYLGLIFGVNLTGPIPETRYSTFSPIDENVEAMHKQYESYNRIGIQAGLEFTYIYRMLNISLQPNFRRQSFSYMNHYEWVDDNNPDNTLELYYKQDHNLDYLEVPLIVKISFLQGNIKPYIGIGGYYGWLVNANKSIAVNGIDKASGSSNPFDKESLSVGATSLFVNYNAGVLGAIGLSYDPGNIRLIMDIQYRYGLTNIANTSNRFTDNRLAGMGDALDDLTLNNIAVNIGILFPLRFLSNEFSSKE